MNNKVCKTYILFMHKRLENNQWTEICIHLCLAVHVLQMFNWFFFPVKTINNNYKAVKQSD